MTPHVLDQLPLWVEGDLNPTEAAAVETHLAQCPTCHESAENLRSSQAWLREGMASPFDAGDQDRLRRRVMDQIRAEAAVKPFPRFKVRPALLAACAASILVASLVWRMEQGRLTRSTAVEVPSTKVAALPPLPVPQPRKIEHQATPRPQARVAPGPKSETESPPLGEPARIEFQTSDPTIRIIWLAQSKPLPDATLPLPEEP
jgi:anti-sigma factor RsiW